MSSQPLSPPDASERYAWARPGDVNAFFGLMLDNIGDMILMAGLLVAAGFPSEFVLSRMIPGTALGVLVGDVIYTGMAFLLARRERRSDVTAMPLGLDTPSTFGTVLLILTPAFLAARKAGLEPLEAARHAWYLGISMLLISGVFKLLCALVSGWIRRLVPQAGLLGSLVSIALVIISFLPLLDIAGAPVAGFVALAMVLASLTARWRLVGRPSAIVAASALGLVSVAVLSLKPEGDGAPMLSVWAALPIGLVVGGALFGVLNRVGQVPGALMAVALGCLVYYGLALANLGPGLGERPSGGLRVALPIPVEEWFWWFQTHWEEAIQYLPVAIPLALTTVVGGIDCTESASAAGDAYPTGPIIAVEGFATLVGGLFGGVIQSTPYIGHPAYKAMGGRAAYTLATGLFVGAAGMLGFFGWIFFLLPRAAVFPILIFVGLEITAQSFLATPKRHYPALVFSCVPALAYLAYLIMDQMFNASGVGFEQFRGETQHWIQTITVLSGGFIVTSLLWGTFLTRLIDGDTRSAALAMVVASGCSLVGIMHSPLRSSPILWPWSVIRTLKEQGRFEASAAQTPYHWAAAYAAMAVLVWLLGRAGERPDGSACEAQELQNH